jgi:predicted amidohydrolase
VKTNSAGFPSGWSTLSPRSEISPAFSFDSEVGHSHPGSLYIDCGENPAAFGAWVRRIENLSGGLTYRFSAYYRAENVSHEMRSVIPRLEWFDENGKSVRPPDFALMVENENEGDWTRVEYSTSVPENTRSVEIQLSLGFAPKGRIWWDEIQIEMDSSPAHRVIRAVTVHHRPRGTASPQASVEEFCMLLESADLEEPDLICLPEGITVVGTGKTYFEVSEPIPGPTTERLGQLARKLNSYLVAGIYERTNAFVHNTAVLIGRQGELAGIYRKTHLPREEWEAGITPGHDYPVFATDFGKVGLLVCWDVQFPEPARAMALKGAEILLLPIWGGSDVLSQARAIENHTFLISSSFDMRSFIVDPSGSILAEANSAAPVAVAELHLDRFIHQPWLGNMKNRTWKERRPDIEVEP